MGRYDLGLSDDEFGEMSPRHFSLLMERREDEHRRADLRAGIVASLIANVHRSKDAEMFTPEMFMPGYRPKQQTPEEMSRIMHGIKAGADVQHCR